MIDRLKAWVSKTNQTELLGIVASAVLVGFGVVQLASCGVPG